MNERNDAGRDALIRDVEDWISEFARAVENTMGWDCGPAIWKAREETRAALESAVRALAEERDRQGAMAAGYRSSWLTEENKRFAAEARAEQATRERDEARRALAFAASVIKCGEPWTETCEKEIGAALSVDAPESEKLTCAASAPGAVAPTKQSDAGCDGAEREDLWDGGFRDEIQCPHCNVIDYEHTDYPRQLQQDGDHVEIACYSCGKPMTVTLCASYTYATEARTDPSHTAAETLAGRDAPPTSLLKSDGAPVVSAPAATPAHSSNEEK